MPLVSIVIPVYNVAPYLQTCIDSIRSQDFTDFELLLVDDGSTDGSGDLCDRIAGEDSRIRVFHKENGGVSSARNLGMLHANGEWISFADADDHLLEHGLQLLVDGISDDVDMVWGGYEVFDEQGEKTYAISARESEFLTNREGLEMLYNPRYYRYLGFVWGRLFRREVLCSSQIRFDEDIKYNEDRLFCTRFMCASAAGIRFFTTPVYGYLERSDSAMGLIEREFRPEFITDMTAFIRMKDVIGADYQEDDRIREMTETSCYESWRRMARMRGYSDSAFRTRTGIVYQLIMGLGLRRFLNLDWPRNRNRIKKFLKKHL